MGVFAALAVAGFVASAATHALTYLAPSAAPGGSVLWLVPNLFVLWPAMIIRSRGLWRRAPARSTDDVRAILEPLRDVPPAVWALGAALVVYAMLNFVLCVGLLREGGPRGAAGGRYLDYKGHRVRSLSEQEYDALSAAEIRLATGHLMLFHAVAAVYFVWVDPRRRRPGRAA